MISDLKRLGQLLDEGKIPHALGAYKPQYPSFIEVEDSIQDIPNGKDYFYTVSDPIFVDGVRPDTWLTPEGADREPRNL